MRADHSSGVVWKEPPFKRRHERVGPQESGSGGYGSQRTRGGDLGWEQGKQQSRLVSFQPSEPQCAHPQPASRFTAPSTSAGLRDWRLNGCAPSLISQPQTHTKKQHEWLGHAFQVYALFHVLEALMKLTRLMKLVKLLLCLEPWAWELNEVHISFLVPGLFPTLWHRIS